MSVNRHRLARLSMLVEEIRGCEDCKTDRYNENGTKRTPFVYKGSDPKILVVSEIPSKEAWIKDVGKKWKDGESFFIENKGIPFKLWSWLNKEAKLDENLFKERVFWVQRANCWVDVGKEYAFQHCSEKFLRRIIETLEPRLIIALGKPAAQYFFQFNKLNEILEIEKRSGIAECLVYGRSYKCLALPHPSQKAAAYQRILQTAEMKRCLNEARNYFTK